VVRFTNGQSAAPSQISITPFIPAWRDIALTRYDSCIAGCRKEERSTARDTPVILFERKQNDPQNNALLIISPPGPRTEIKAFVYFARGCLCLHDV